MKRTISLVLMLCMLSLAALAAELPDLTTYTDEELLLLEQAVLEEQNNRGINYATLQQGSSGDTVKALQLRLIELCYLSGSADGNYGAQTKAAVELFQKSAGLEATGVADVETQIALFADGAPVAKIYLDLDFQAISRDPDAYTGKNYQFSGKVLQVMEESYDSYTLTAMRIATKGNYDNVVYVFYLRPKNEARILEEDNVTVYAECQGLYTYTSTMGKEISLPQFMAESVSLK